MTCNMYVCSICVLLPVFCPASVCAVSRALADPVSLVLCFPSSSSVAVAGSRRTLRRLRVPEKDGAMPQGKRKRS